MNNGHQKHNFQWACEILNLSLPRFDSCSSEEQAKQTLEQFKALAKTKFRKIILIKHEDKGGDRQITQDLIEANRIIKDACIQRAQPQLLQVRFSQAYYGYGGAADSSAYSGTTTSGWQ